MTHELEAVFGELGIAQYLDAFIDQGFDSWETILDITESDLDALGVKLGHRRKLQRRIANARGVAPGASLVSPLPASATAEDGSKPEAEAKLDVLRIEPRIAGPTVVSKRKYRRHPKPDENAPERPPSAYVLFSNKMREELKGRNLSFTEIAKLVGENWQSLSPSEKGPYETDAQMSKDKYILDFAEYKKTPEYKKYSLYLQEFKAKYAHQSQEKDAAKRVKLSEHGESIHGGRSSRSGSGSESQLEGEPPPRASHHGLGLERLDSVVSTTDSQYSATTPASLHASADEPMTSPATHTADRCFSENSDRSPRLFSANIDDRILMAGRRGSTWSTDARMDLTQPGHHQPLPPLSDMLESRSPFSGRTASTEVHDFSFGRSCHSGSPGPPPGLVGGDTRPSLLNHEQSSTGSMSSTNSSASLPRTPLDRPSLPIHALLVSKPTATYEAGQGPPLFHGSPMVFGPNKPPSAQISMSSTPVASVNSYPTGTRGSQPLVNSPRSDGSGYFGSAIFSPPTLGPSRGTKQDASASADSGSSSGGGGGSGGGSSLDGMSALLKAGEMVDRRAW